MLSGEGQHHLASAAVAVCKGIECLLEVLCLEHMLFIVASTLVTASAVSMCGQVGWIGLLIPHASRMLVGSNSRYVVPLSLSLGASFMILIDTLSRSISIIELPLSILTAIIGAPAFISLLNKTRSNLQ